MNRHFIGILLVGAVVFLLEDARTVFSQGLRLAVVDIQKAVEKSNAGKKARTVLEREKQRLEVKLIKKRTTVELLIKEIRELQQEIQQKGPILRPAQREKKNTILLAQKRKFTRQQDELKRMLQESRRDLSLRNNRLMRSIFAQVREVVNEIGGKREYDMIVERAQAGVLYLKEGLDITDQVIDLYNKKKK